MDSLERNISRLPPDLKKEVADFVEFLLEKRVQPQNQQGYLKLSWRGALSDMKGEFDAVGLQHEALKWRGG